MNATSGRRCLESFERLPRPGLWAKTWAALLVGQEGWYSRRCKLTWRLKGTKYNRMYFHLQVSTLRTEETGFGLLPTVVANASNRELNEDGESISAKGNKFGVSIQQLAKAGLLPTPDCSDRRGPNSKQQALNNVIKNGMLAAPTASDYKGCCMRTGKNAVFQESMLQHQIHYLTGQETGKTSQLNPLFVTEMMGYPPDYLVLPFLNGETNQ